MTAGAPPGARAARVPRPIRTLLAGLGLVALIAPLACAGAGPDAAPPQGAGSATPGGTAAGGRYTVGPCPFAPPPVEGGRSVRVECATLRVPESRADPSGPTIELAVARVHAGNDRAAADPVLYLEGGPGGSALAGVGTWTDPVSPILAAHDIVLLDQRGSGYSSPRLTCDPEFSDATDRDTDGDLLDRCHARLTGAGIRLDAYSTVESADDVDDLRAALGLRSWPLFGVSYGTRVALETMRRHPDGVRSAVLDSTFPATVAGLEDQPRNFWAALRALLDDCRADPACNTAYPDLESRFVAAVARLDRDAATVPAIDPDTGATTSAEVTGADLVAVLFDALYVSDRIPDVPKALDAAARGETGLAFALLDPEGEPGATQPAPEDGAPVSSDLPPSDTDGLFLTIECAEEAARATISRTEDASAEVPAPIRAALVAEVEAQLDECRHWPVQPQVLAPVSADTPTLVLGGEYDPITPVRWGELAASTLPRSRVLSFPGAGHGIIDAGPCALGVIVAFLADPGRMAATCARADSFTVG